MAGLWLWKGGAGLFPVARELVWQLPADRAAIQTVEVQLWDGTLLVKREEVRTPNGAGPDLVERLALRAGTYQARAFVTRQGSAAPQVYASQVRLGDEETVVIPIR